MSDLNNLTLVIPVPQQVRFGGKRYALSMVFEPVRRTDGRLVAVEMLSRLADAGTPGEWLSPEAFYARGRSHPVTSGAARPGALPAGLPAVAAGKRGACHAEH
ncbi:hypothetical protein ABFY58_27510 [Enterobacter soli]